MELITNSLEEIMKRLDRQDQTHKDLYDIIRKKEEEKTKKAEEEKCKQI